VKRIAWIRSHTRGLSILAVAIAAIVVAVGGYSLRAHANGGPALDLAHLSSFTNPSNVVAGVPAQAKILGSEFAPQAGQVHTLGYGAVGWIADRRPCWATSYSAGCLENLSVPIDVSVGDPDIAGSGAPTAVYGASVDGVDAVTVTLDDGRTFVGQSTGNFYRIELPQDAANWNVKTVSATFGSVGQYSTQLNIPKPN
jgi:hypothetical protein